MDAQNWEIVLDVLAERIAKLTDDLIKSKARANALEEDLDKTIKEMCKLIKGDK